MRAKWRKIIWAILALQLFVIHLLVLKRDYHLDYLIDKVVWHFGLPGVLYYRWRQLAVLLCLAVAAGILLFHYRNYRKFRGQCIRRLEPVTEEAVKRSLQEAVRETGLDKRMKREGEQRTFLYRCPDISDPFVIGFRNPILLLPEKTYDDTVLQFIFLHECRHMRQRDTVYKLFMLLMQSLLWFQPLMYLLKAVADRDVEVACDEAVVEGRDMERRKAYGYALLECMRQDGDRKKAYSAYFYHGKRIVKARIAAIMKEDKKWDFLAYVSIGVLLLELGCSMRHFAGILYTDYGPEPVPTPIYEGYEIPESFTREAVEHMTALAPAAEDAYYQELWSGDFYQETEYGDLPYAAEGPWQIRLKDADHYAEAVRPLLQRYLYYYIDWDWATQWDAENNMTAGSMDIVYNRLLAGNKQEAVFAVVFRCFLMNEDEIADFPEELASRAQFVQEGGAYYAYFNWTIRICMVKDYVFALEGIADTDTVLEAFTEAYAQTDFRDVPELDLVNRVYPAGRDGAETNRNAEEGVQGPGENGEENPEEDRDGNPAELSAAAADRQYQIEVSKGVVQISGSDGVMREVPVPMEELLYRGDQMDGRLTSLQDGSFQVDEKKQIFAYGGDQSIPISVVYFDQESQSFEKTVVTRKYFGGRKIFVHFPENSQEGFLIFTGERVVWQESTILFHTEDGGRSWQEVGAAGPDFSSESHSLTTDAAFINNRVGFLTIRDSETPDIWRTQDGGKSWEKQVITEVPPNYSMAYAPEERDGVLYLYVGMEDYSKYGGTKAKYESRDEGESWTYQGLVLRK